MHERPVLAEGPPEIRFRRAKARLEPALHVRVRPGRRRELEQVGDQGVRVLDRDALVPEPPVIQAGRAQQPLHRLMDDGVVLGGDGMQRDPHQLVLHHGLLGEGGVEVRRIERIEPVPQRDVRGRGLLRLEGDQAMDRVGDAESLAPQQELPGERRSVELSSGEVHAPMVPQARGGKRARNGTSPSSMGHHGSMVTEGGPPPEERLERLGAAAREVLDASWIGASTLPSRTLYPHQWNWDSAFIAIGRSWYDEPKAQQELRSLFGAQWANGKVPSIVFNPSVGEDAYFPGPAFWQTSTRSAQAPRGVETSGSTQPPIHARAALEMHRHARDVDASKAFLAWLYPRLVAEHAYLTDQRDPTGSDSPRSSIPGNRAWTTHPSGIAI